MFTLPQIILTLLQLGWSWWLKNYTTFTNKWIPLLNVGIGLGVFTVIEVISKPQGGAWAAILTVLSKALETAIAATGIHSAMKNTFASTKA
jgi:hypothetical protein